MEEILHHLGCIKNPVNNRINYRIKLHGERRISGCHQQYDSKQKHHQQPQVQRITSSNLAVHKMLHPRSLPGFWRSTKLEDSTSPERCRGKGRDSAFRIWRILDSLKRSLHLKIGFPKRMISQNATIFQWLFLLFQCTKCCGRKISSEAGNPAFGSKQFTVCWFPGGYLVLWT